MFFLSLWCSVCVICCACVGLLKLQTDHNPISTGVHRTAFKALWSNYCDSSWDNAANNGVSLSLTLLSILFSSLMNKHTQKLSQKG